MVIYSFSFFIDDFLFYTNYLNLVFQYENMKERYAEQVNWPLGMSIYLFIFQILWIFSSASSGGMEIVFFGLIYIVNLMVLSWLALIFSIKFYQQSPKGKKEKSILIISIIFSLSPYFAMLL
jgi:hypothetical protein